jgi:LemA protein
MKIGKKWIGVIIGVIAIALITTFFIIQYNKLAEKQEVVNNEFAKVELKLQARIDIIPTLVDTVKSYTKDEIHAYTNVTESTNNFLKATTVAEKVAANQQITNSLNELIYEVRQNYPELSASSNFTQIMDELAGAESEMAVVINDYDEVVKNYNSAVENNIMADIFGFETTTYFKTDVAH